LKRASGDKFFEVALACRTSGQGGFGQALLRLDDILAGFTLVFINRHFWSLRFESSTVIRLKKSAENRAETVSSEASGYLLYFRVWQTSEMRYILMPVV
jgi:hypothetical protein